LDDDYRNEARFTERLLHPKTPGMSLLDRLPGWRRLYAVVHVREDPAARSPRFPVGVPRHSVAASGSQWRAAGLGTSFGTSDRIARPRHIAGAL
jgi:hypothetical protein